LSSTKNLIIEYNRAIELWLQLAVAGHYRNNDGLTENALDKATEIARGNSAAGAELAYCKGIIAWLKKNLEEAKGHLENANTLNPGVGRILELLGYVNWRLGDRGAAIEKTEEALRDESIPDPKITITVLNNLAYFYCEEAKETGEISLINKAYDLTADLPEYHRVFRRRDASWLDTRGLTATRMAKHLADQPHERDKARDVLRIALQILKEALDLESENRYIKDHWKEARDLERKLTGSTKRTPTRSAVDITK
jgi:tetratricopeptide (TPR) repeat protein